MINRWRHRIPTITVATLAASAAIVTVILLVGLWTGWRVSARMEAVVQRLDPQIEETAGSSEHGEGDGVAEDPVQAEGGSKDAPGKQKEAKAKPDPAARAVARINKQNLFSSPPAKPDFKEIIGVLGDRVLYPGDVSVGIGESHSGATVKAIGSHWVKFEYEGKIVPVNVFGEQPQTKPKPKEAKDNKTKPGDETKGDTTPDNEAGTNKIGTESTEKVSPQPAASQPTHAVKLKEK